jgi:hypothetical protein
MAVEKETNLDQIAKLVAAHMFVHFVNDFPNVFPIIGIRTHFGNSISQNVLAFALQQLITKSVVEADSPYIGVATTMSLRESGFILMQSGRYDEKSWAYNLVQFYNDFCASHGLVSEPVSIVERIAGRSWQAAPASDRTVSLDHNGDPYKDAVANLDKLIAEFKDDHRLDNELGAEKPALLDALEAGRKLLDDSTINIRIGIALIVEPIKIVIEKYKDKIIEGVVSGLAHGTLDLILSLLGIK